MTKNWRSKKSAPAKQTANLSRHQAQHQHPSRQLEAVAISYNSSCDNAPYIADKGIGHSANNILRLARRYGISVVENPALVHELSGTIEVEIPEDLYSSVAEQMVKVGLR